jgi:hypothetical protein
MGGVSGQRQSPAPSPPHKEPPILKGLEPGWSPELVWRVFRMQLAVTSDHLGLEGL